MYSTIIFEKQKTFYEPKMSVFGVFNYDSIPNIDVEYIKDGIVKIYPPAKAHINEFAEFVAGAFDAESNFASVICEHLKVPVDSFKGISFDFNDFHFEITKENANAKWILKEWNKQWKKYRREHLFKF